MSTATATMTMADYLTNGTERLDFNSPVEAYHAARRIRKNLHTEGMADTFEVFASNMVVRIKRLAE